MKRECCHFYGLLSFVFIFTNPSSGVFSQQSCNSFKNILIEFKTHNGDFFNQTINGCIERIKFHNKETVTEALIKRQDDIIRLGKDSVRNMIRLSKLSFVGCNYLEIIEPGCFRNVPTLQKVQISFCKIKTISKDVFDSVSELQILRLNNNLVTLIEDEAFANLSSLRRIYLGNNKIKTWNKDWFRNSNSIEIIDFQFNKVQKIPPSAFTNLRKLKEIHFGNNIIDIIDTDAFANVEHLEYLDLSHNKLKEINSNSFPRHLEIDHLKLNGNLLNFLFHNVMKRLDINRINIHYNPWNCQCLERIYQWIGNNNIILDRDVGCQNENIPECAVSNDHPSTCNEYVDEKLGQRYVETFKKIPEILEKCSHYKNSLLGLDESDITDYEI